MLNVQQTDIRGVIDKLDTSPPNTNLPNLDEKTLSWVYPLDPAWIVPGFFGFETNTFDIGGGNALFVDAGNAPGANVIPAPVYGGAPNARQSRSYFHLRVRFQGGITNPISGAVQIGFVGTAAFTVALFSITNPGELWIGPVLVAPTTQLRILNTSGVAGDTITIQGFGARADAGVPLILPSAMRIIEG